MPEVRYEVPDWKVTRVEIDAESGTATIYRTKGNPIQCYLTEFSWGPQGTWIRAVPVNDLSYAICIGQSGTMPHVVYIVYEEQFIPDTPPESIVPEGTPTEVVF